VQADDPNATLQSRGSEAPVHDLSSTNEQIDELRGPAGDTATGPMLPLAALDNRQIAANRHDSVDSVVPLPLASWGDAELVAGIIERRPKAIAQLYDSYAPLVRGLLVRTLGTTHDLDDLAQDTFMTVISRCSALRDPTALRSFVVGVTFRMARNALRKRALRRFVALEDAHEVAVAPCCAETAECVRHVYRVLDKLDSNLRVAFVTRHVEGYELAEAAQLCGCSLATYKRRLSRAESRFEALSRSDPVLKTLSNASGRAP
jgi:RNA polymerase sigma-70 factor, ECF subfamily